MFGWSDVSPLPPVTESSLPCLRSPPRRSSTLIDCYLPLLVFLFFTLSVLLCNLFEILLLLPLLLFFFALSLLFALTILLVLFVRVFVLLSNLLLPLFSLSRLLLFSHLFASFFFCQSFILSRIIFFFVGFIWLLSIIVVGICTNPSCSRWLFGDYWLSLRLLLDRWLSEPIDCID